MAKIREIAKFNLAKINPIKVSGEMLKKKPKGRKKSLPEKRKFKRMNKNIFPPKQISFKKLGFARY